MNILKIDLSSGIEVIFFILGVGIILISILIFGFAFQRIKYGTSGYTYDSINEQSKFDRKARFRCHMTWAAVLLGLGSMIMLLFFVSK